MVIRTNHVSGELLPSTIKDARFHTSASSAATIDLTPPRRRLAARSRSSSTRKMPKISTPAECPSVLTSRDSFTVQSYRMGIIGDCFSKMQARFKTALWLAWAAIAVLLTSGIVRWHVEYFRSPGPQFYRAAVIGLPAAGGGSPGVDPPADQIPVAL